MPPEFALQSVLDYRHSQVEALEIQLGRWLAALQREQELLCSLRASRDDRLAALRQQQAGLIDLTAVAQLRLSLKRLEAQITRHVEAVAETARRAEEHRHKLVAAKQDEEALATLKQKELDRFRAEMRRRENRLHDDIYIAQTYRRAVAASGSAASL